MAGINANYFGRGHHGPQGLIKATTMKNGGYDTLFSPYLNSISKDSTDKNTGLGIAANGRLLLDRNFYAQHADFIGRETGEGRAVTAGPRIVHQGQVLPEDDFRENCSEEDYSSVFCTNPRPRAALGIIGEKGLILTVGQKSYLRDTALLLQRHGVQEGMKLDDGSSAQLWYINEPFVPSSGGGDVVNAILIYSKPIARQIQAPFSMADTVLLMDVSGSMGDSWQGGIKLKSAEEAAAKVIDMIEASSLLPGSASAEKVAIATFSSSAELNLPLANDYNNARSTIASLTPLDKTNIGAGLKAANNALLSTPNNKGKIIFLLSDGLTNEGMSVQEILNGPVQQAADAGICIYTIGFGDKGSLDEALLQEIANRTSCGEYYYADINLKQGLLVLENGFIKNRHTSVRTIITEFTGNIGQGETTTPRQFNVAAQHDLIVGTLNWPGSELDLMLTDPQGRLVDNNYRGVQINRFNGLLYVAVQDPVPGAWQVSIFGRDVPDGVTPYNVIFSGRKAILPPQPQASFSIFWLVLLLLALLLGGGIAFVIMDSRRVKADQAGLRLISGQAAPPWARLMQGHLHIGRAPNNDVVISDPQVSGRHAQIRKIPQGYLMEDLDSRNGVFINGQRVQKQIIHAGDEVQIGRAKFKFEAVLGAGAARTVVGQPPLPAQVGGTGLRLLAGKAASAWAGFNQGQLRIGRDADNEMVITDDNASRRHARIYQTAQGYLLEDLRSRNGTLVNGQKISQQLLQNGDVIQIGQTQFRFEIQS